MRRIILGIIPAAVAALALSGCATVSDTLSTVTGTQTEDRCAWYETRLPVWREIATLAAPGSVRGEIAAANILVGEAYLAAHCALVLGTEADGIAIE